MDHVRSWVLDGEIQPETLPEQPACWSSTVVTGLSEAPFPQPDPKNATSPSTSSPSSSASPSTEQMRGAENDALIPNQSQINQVFNDGHETWRQFHQVAQSYPRGTFPAGLDPSIMMKDMPPLPDTVPRKGVLVGSPTWIVPDAEQREPQPSQPSQRIGRHLDLNQVTGVTKYFRLAYEIPLACQLNTDSNSPCYGKTSSSAQRSTAPDGLAILTIS